MPACLGLPDPPSPPPPAAQILSETKDPTRVQPHLKKCFEGVSKLDFGPDLSIHAMVSAEQEVVHFKEHISTRAANGKVEEWLLQVEEAMFASIHDVTAKVRRIPSSASRPLGRAAAAGDPPPLGS